MRSYDTLFGDGGGCRDGGTEIISRGDGGSDGISMVSATRPAFKPSVAFPALTIDSGTQV